MASRRQASCPHTPHATTLAHRLHTEYRVSSDCRPCMCPLGTARMTQATPPGARCRSNQFCMTPRRRPHKRCRHGSRARFCICPGHTWIAHSITQPYSCSTYYHQSASYGDTYLTRLPICLAVGLLLALNSTHEQGSLLVLNSTTQVKDIVIYS